MNALRAAAALFLTAVSALAFAGEIKPYDQAAVDKLAADGKPVVIAVHASWCPTCKAQAPIQSELMREPANKEVTMFIVDFDRDKALLKKYNVGMQSTMIGFKGRQEVSRSVGDTTHDGIETLIRKTHA